MSDKIETEILYVAEDFVRAIDFVQYHHKSSKIIFGFGKMFFSVFAVLSFTIAYLSFNEDGLSSSVVFIISGFAGLFLGFGLKNLQRIINRWSLNKQYKSSPILQRKQQMLFDEAGIKGQTDISSGETKWKAIIKANETNEDFFFFTSNKFALFVPKRSLTNIQIIGLRELANRNLGEKTDF